MVGISECLAADEGTCTRTLGSAAQKKGDQTEVTSEIKEYLASRKAVRRAINKTLGNLKFLEYKYSSSIDVGTC